VETQKQQLHNQVESVDVQSNHAQNHLLASPALARVCFGIFEKQMYCQGRNHSTTQRQYTKQVFNSLVEPL
jgi:hypothetical protein